MKRIIPKSTTIRHHYHYHKIFNAPSLKKHPSLIVDSPSTPNGSSPKSTSGGFFVDNKEMIKRVLFLFLFVLSESLPFLETDSNGIFHHIGKTLKKVSNNNSCVE
jgi:hypothetical protein